MQEETHRLIIVFSLSTTFPHMLVNKSWIPGVSIGAHSTNQYAH